MALLALMPVAPRSASAADGCTVMLCLAGNWRHIAACVPPVRDALRDLALGHGMPRCSTVSSPDIPTASGLASGMLDAASCPPQYLAYQHDDDGNVIGAGCLMWGAVSVTVDGALWSRTYWSGEGAAVTWYADSARTQLGSVDDQYDRDLTAWRDSSAFTEWDCIANGNCAVQPGPSGGGD